MLKRLEVTNMGCSLEVPKDDLAERIAAARAIGLSDDMADQIKMIDWIPEFRPDRKPVAMTFDLAPR